MNNLTISLFLELIKSAIWNRKAEETLFTDIDEQIWTELVSFAESQSVSALLYDGIMTLPESVWPDRKIIYKLFLQTQFIEKRNRRFNEELKNIFWEYEKLNTPFILLKGQGNRSEEHTSELQSRPHLVCRLLLEKKKKKKLT